MLSWDGDPYAGQIDVEALHTLRANVTPLVGEINGQGRRMEDVQVSLLLWTGTCSSQTSTSHSVRQMQKTSCSPPWPVCWSTTPASAQPAKLLSLQGVLYYESLPGLGHWREPSTWRHVDVSGFSVTNSSRLTTWNWIVAYIAIGALLTEEESQQDALQLAMK